jgi:hypothetical protein
MGPMNLDGTDNVLSTDQAKKILPLWQALRSSINTGGSGTAELGALVLQIEEELTADQVTAINAMRLTRTDMRNWAQAQGLMPAGFSAEMMATQQAAAGQTGQLGKAGVALLDSVVEYLEGLAQKS